MKKENIEPPIWSLVMKISKRLMSKEEFEKEYQGVFESAVGNGTGFMKIDKNGNVKHIPNNQIFKEQK